MVKLSVIVPVYNVEKYIEKCLESLVNQTLGDIEIIIVNDGTEDNSQEIIDKYVRNYPNKIKAYIKENGGLSSARNFGLKYAQGKYIAFVDSDDYLELNMFEKMYEKAVSNNFDVVVCNFNYVYEDRIVGVNSNIKHDLNTQEEIKASMVNFYPAVWNKIYHKRLFEHGVEFKQNIWYEDVEWMYRIYSYIKSIGQIDYYGYNYVQRDGAISKTYNKKLFDYISNWNGIIDFYKKNRLYTDYEKELEYSYVRYIYGTFIKNVMRIRDRAILSEATYEAIKTVKEKFPRYRKNKYFYKSGLKGLYLVFFNRLFVNLLYIISNYR